MKPNWQVATDRETNETLILKSAISHGCRAFFINRKEEIMNEEREITMLSTDGEYEVDAENGMVMSFCGNRDLSQLHEPERPCRFDVAELKIRYGDSFITKFRAFDILNVGWWDIRGIFTPPCEIWQNDTRENNALECSNLLGIEVDQEEIPGAVLWRSTTEELLEWINNHLKRRLLVSFTDDFEIEVPIDRIGDLQQKSQTGNLNQAGLEPFKPERVHHEIVIMDEDGDKLRRVAREVNHG